MKERLHKVMAEAGVGSRRRCEQLIKENRVRVNGEPAHLGQKVNPREDQILVNGKHLPRPEAKRYLILNKPRSYITTAKEQFGRRSVLDLLPEVAERLYPVGRLDYDSEGLVLLTNDGDLAHRVMHPSYELPKTYLVHLARVNIEAVEQLRSGVILEDGPTAPCQVKVLKPGRGQWTLQITITEGRNRQIRRMCSAVGLQVLRLRRVGIGPLSLSGLKSGSYRSLSAREIRELKQAVAK